ICKWLGTGDLSRWSEDTTSVVPPIASAPPASFGLQMRARSWTEAGGKDNPLGCGTRPVALHTAVISMPDLVPSMKLLNIFGFIPPRAAFSGVIPKLPHTVSGVDWWNAGW